MAAPRQQCRHGEEQRGRDGHAPSLRMRSRRNLSKGIQHKFGGQKSQFTRIGPIRAAMFPERAITGRQRARRRPQDQFRLRQK